MKCLHHKTPLIESLPLSKILDSRVYLKLEALQPTGSFKIRGIGRACQIAISNGAQALVASSGGNAGHAVAFSGRHLDLPVTVVVPDTTPLLMQEKLRDEGAMVIQQGASWDDSHEAAVELARKKNAVYIHPFDHPHIWTGHASLIEEIKQSNLCPDLIVLAVGGGGVLCGILEGLYKVGWQDIPICAVETEGAASFAQSVNSGRRVTLDRITSLATCLGARRVASKAFDWIKSHPITSLTVSDESAVRGVLRFSDDHRILVEPACGAALAPIYEKLELFSTFKKILIVVCGGSGVTQQLIKKWMSQLDLNIS